MISKCFCSILLAVVTLLSSPAHADSDGSFCTANGYVAYELYNQDESSKVLRIVKFDSADGIYIAGEVTLSNISVKGLLCQADRVVISGWSSIFEQYTIGVPSVSAAGLALTKHSLEILEHHTDPAAKFDPVKWTPEPRSLVYDPVGSYPLETSDSDHKYFLVISGSDKSAQGEIKHRRIATVVENTQGGIVSHRLQFYENVRVETID